MDRSVNNPRDLGPMHKAGVIIDSPNHLEYHLLKRRLFNLRIAYLLTCALAAAWILFDPIRLLGGGCG